MSYSVRQGDRRGTELEFPDFTYDGMRQDNFLLDGLGQLTDGEIGDFNFRLDNQELKIKGYSSFCCHFGPRSFMQLHNLSSTCMCLMKN